MKPKPKVLPDLECRLFQSFHGEVTDIQGAAVCVRGIENTRCHWFFGTMLAPAPRW
jgi:hypothetical protein